MEQIDLPIERLFGKSLCSSIERIDSHIKKHSLSMGRRGYLEIGEKVSNGQEGKHTEWIESQSRWYTVVVTGKVTKDGREFGILRSVRAAGGGPLTCEIHGNVPYAHGNCPFCN